MAKSSLYSFIRKHCANWEEKRECSYGSCKVMDGKPCAYFERFVWAIGDPSYPYASDTVGYLKRLKEYKTINKSFRVGYSGKKSRLCECGMSLQTGRRMCDSCRKRHAAESRKKHKSRESVRGELT